LLEIDFLKRENFTRRRGFATHAQRMQLSHTLDTISVGIVNNGRQRNPGSVKRKAFSSALRAT